MNGTTLDYRYLLPILAALPTPIGYKLSRLRGKFYLRLNRDWRMLTGVDADVDLRTQMALVRLYPKASQAVLKALRQARYEAQSVAEWVAERLAQHRIQTQPPVLPADLPSNAVYITAHYAASIEATYWLNQLFPTLLMTSSVVEQHRIPLAIQQHYQRKYAALEHRHVESAPNAFLRQLKKGYSIVLLADLPGDVSNQTCVETEWGIASLAAGARRLAESSDRPLIAYTALYSAQGQWQFTFSAPCYPSQSNPDWYQGAYQHLIHQLTHYPEHWWAMDLLPLWYPR